MKIIDSIEDFGPRRNDYFGRLTKEEKKKYINLMVLYYDLLIKYIDKKTNIVDVDNKFKNSTLNYVSVEEENMDIYQYISSDSLKYLYIRNNIYIESLNNAEVNFLNKVLENNAEYNDEIDNFINNTYKKVITEPGDKNYEVLFCENGISRNYMVQNGTLVIGFRYDTFNLNGMNDNEWNSNHNEKISEIFSITEVYSFMLNASLGIPCKILEYNDFNVKKKSIEKNKIMN